MANQLRCKVDELPTRYVGLPSKSNSKRDSPWNPIIEKICKNKLRERKFLSWGGRLTLIKSALANLIPIFYVSIFKIPQKQFWISRIDSLGLEKAEHFTGLSGMFFMLQSTKVVLILGQVQLWTRPFFSNRFGPSGDFWYLIMLNFKHIMASFSESSNFAVAVKQVMRVSVGDGWKSKLWHDNLW